MFKKVRKHSQIWTFIRIRTKCLYGIFWADTRPSSKFHRNLFGSFCVILQTNQQTNRETHVGENMTSLVDVMRYFSGFEHR